MIQFAISQDSLTYKAPSIVKSKWPPRIIANDWDDENKEPPGSKVTVSYENKIFFTFPALIKSGSTFAAVGYGPTPKIPF